MLEEIVEKVENADAQTGGEADAFIAFLSVCGPVGGSYGAAVTVFRDHYMGNWGSVPEFVESLIADLDLPEWVRSSLDIRSFTRSVVLGNRQAPYWVTATRGGNGVFVFKRLPAELRPEKGENDG